MKLRLFALPVILLTAVLFVSACGSDSNSTATEGTTKITASETIFALDHLLDVGFKKDKSFDVEGLTAVTHAYYGFWGLDPYDRKEYEVRFYASHADAVEFGTIFADERTGPDAVIKSGDTMWEEGAKYARACVRISSNASCHLSKYGDYIIYGNMIHFARGEIQRHH